MKIERATRKKSLRDLIGVDYYRHKTMLRVTETKKRKKVVREPSIIETKSSLRGLVFSAWRLRCGHCWISRIGIVLLSRHRKLQPHACAALDKAIHLFWSIVFVLNLVRNGTTVHTGYARNR